MAKEKQSHAKGTFGIYSFICVRMCNFLFLCALYFMFAVFPIYIFVAMNVRLECMLFFFVFLFVCCWLPLFSFTVPQFFGYYCFFALLMLFASNAHTMVENDFSLSSVCFFSFFFEYKMLFFFASFFFSVVTYNLFYLTRNHTRLGHHHRK